MKFTKSKNKNKSRGHLKPKPVEFSAHFCSLSMRSRSLPYVAAAGRMSVLTHVRASGHAPTGRAASNLTVIFVPGRMASQQHTKRRSFGRYGAKRSCRTTRRNAAQYENFTVDKPEPHGHAS